LGRKSGDKVGKCKNVFGAVTGWSAQGNAARGRCQWRGSGRRLRSSPQTGCTVASPARYGMECSQ